MKHENINENDEKTDDGDSCKYSAYDGIGGDRFRAGVRCWGCILLCAIVANIKIIAVITVEACATDEDVVCVATETHGFLGEVVRV